MARKTMYSYGPWAVTVGETVKVISVEARWLPKEIEGKTARVVGIGSMGPVRGGRRTWATVDLDIDGERVTVHSGDVSLEVKI